MALLERVFDVCDGNGLEQVVLLDPVRVGLWRIVLLLVIGIAVILEEVATHEKFLFA